jgi:hypothetical protein
VQSTQHKNSVIALVTLTEIFFFLLETFFLLKAHLLSLSLNYLLMIPFALSIEGKKFYHILAHSLLVFTHFRYDSVID